MPLQTLEFAGSVPLGPTIRPRPAYQPQLPRKRGFLRLVFLPIGFVAIVGLFAVATIIDRVVERWPRPPA